jgi:hypothetical protein
VDAEMSKRHTLDPDVPPYTEAPDGKKETLFRAMMYGATLELPNVKAGSRAIVLAAT